MGWVPESGGFWFEGRALCCEPRRRRECEPGRERSNARGDGPEGGPTVARTGQPSGLGSSLVSDLSGCLEVPCPTGRRSSKQSDRHQRVGARSPAGAAGDEVSARPPAQSDGRSIYVPGAAGGPARFKTGQEQLAGRQNALLDALLGAVALPRKRARAGGRVSSWIPSTQSVLDKDSTVTTLDQSQCPRTWLRRPSPERVQLSGVSRF